MGTIVPFPDGPRLRREARATATCGEPASVIILPVVRIERGPTTPSDGVSDRTGATPGRRRRRRAART